LYTYCIRRNGIICQWRLCVGDAGVLLLKTLYSFSFFFFLFIPLSHQTLRSLLLGGNKRDRIDTLTQCTELLQFVVDYFLSAIWLTQVGFTSSNTSCNGEHTL